MPGNRRNLYWDSCIFIHYIENDLPERTVILERLLEDSEARLGDIQIITSTLTIAEVAYVEKEKINRRADFSIEARIDELWDSPAIRLVEFFPEIAKQARTLVREMQFRYRRSLKPPDAIHLATALYMQAEEFHTYDDKLLKLEDKAGVSIVMPHGYGSLQGRLPLQSE